MKHCPLHHVPYVPAKFEVATAHGLGDAFTIIYIIWPWHWGQGHTKCCPVPSISCNLCTSKAWFCYIPRLRRGSIYKEMHLQGNSLFDLDIGVKVTRNATQYPLHHVTYSAAKFEVATSNGLGEDTFTRKYITWPLTLALRSQSHQMLLNTLYIMWPMHKQSFAFLFNCTPVGRTSDSMMVPT